MVLVTTTTKICRHASLITKI